MAKIIILGAGLTGLSTAYHLEKNNFYDYAIFEKEPHVGGLCRSVHQDGFIFDFTGHLIHINDSYFRSFIENTIKVEHLQKINRRAFAYLYDRYVPYPLQNNLSALPKEVIVECIEGFIQKKTNNHTKTYYQWILKHFGPGLGKHFFFPYQKKILDYDNRKISSKWTSRFFPMASLNQIISGAITKNEETQIGYNATFSYPKKGGIFSWIKTIEKQIKTPVQKNFCAKQIDMKNKIILFENGHFEKFDTLINTIPLNIFLKKLKEKSSTFLQTASKKLLCNSIVNFNLGVLNSDISDKHWIYFSEKKFPFYRIGFYHNFSNNVTPKGCGSIYGEISHINQSKKFLSQQLASSLNQTKKLFGISDCDILTEKIINIPHAYVIYDFWREKHLPHIHKKLKKNSIYSIGRYGEWKYSSMQEAILDGKLIAETLTLNTNKIKQNSKQNRKKRNFSI